MSYIAQMSGLVVQQFMSAAVGLVVAIAMIRGFTRSRTDKLGNFWVDVTRAVVRLLIPLAIVGGLILIAGGAIENFSAYHTVTTLSGGAPDDPRRPGGLLGGHQGHGEQRRRLVQHQLRAPVREPEPVHEHLRDLPAAADPVRHAARVRQDGQGQPAGLRAGRGHGRSSGSSRSAGSACSRRTPAPAAPRRCRAATPRRAWRPGSAHRAARCSPRPRRSPRPGR